MTAIDYSINAERLPKIEAETDLALARKVHVAHAFNRVGVVRDMILDPSIDTPIHSTIELAPNWWEATRIYANLSAEVIVSAVDLHDEDPVRMLFAEDRARVEEMKRSAKEASLRLRARTLRKTARIVGSQAISTAISPSALVRAIRTRDLLAFKTEQELLDTGLAPRH